MEPDHGPYVNIKVIEVPWTKGKNLTVKGKEEGALNKVQMTQ